MPKFRPYVNEIRKYTQLAGTQYSIQTYDNINSVLIQNTSDTFCSISINQYVDGNNIFSKQAWRSIATLLPGESIKFNGKENELLRAPITIYLNHSPSYAGGNEYANFTLVVKKFI
jgi:hypothetical protein